MLWMTDWAAPLNTIFGSAYFILFTSFPLGFFSAEVTPRRRQAVLPDASQSRPTRFLDRSSLGAIFRCLICATASPHRPADRPALSARLRGGASRRRSRARRNAYFGSSGSHCPIGLISPQ